MIVAENIYDSLPLLTSDRFARSNCCLSDKNFIGAHYIAIQQGLAKLSSGRAPAVPGSRGYCLRPDFQEMEEWESPATEQEIIDAINEQRWCEDTLEVSRKAG